MKILLTTIATLCLLSACQSEIERSNATVDSQPNIIILFADDLGYGDLSVYGHPSIYTPHLDAMAGEGMKMTQFYTAAPICTPSRAALLTGRLPVRSGMCSDKRGVLFPDSQKGLPPSEITIARALQGAGYATACIGKWHLGHRSPYLPTDHGFDYYFGIPYSNDMSPQQSGVQRYPPLPLMEQDSVIEEEPDQGKLTRRYTEKALDFISREREAPFFLYLAYTFPHVPLYADEEFEGKSRRGLYGDVVQMIDWSVGQIMKRLREEGMAQNTLVVFTSDNGPWLVMREEGGSAGLLHEGKNTTWEGGMREPAIFWWPGTIPAGTVQPALASTLDLFPTALGLAGVPLPADRVYDGYDLMPVLRQQTDDVRTSMPYYSGTRLQAFRSGPWKIHLTTVELPYTAQVQVVQHDPPLLFNVETDPSERYELSEEHPEIVARLQGMVREHLAGVEVVASQLED